MQTGFQLLLLLTSQQAGSTQVSLSKAYQVTAIGQASALAWVTQHSLHRV